MDSKNTNKNSSNGEIENPDEFIFNKINDSSDINEQSTKINIEQPSISNKDKKENDKGLYSNLSKNDENHISKTNEDNDKNELPKTDKELVKEIKKNNYKNLFNISQLCDYRKRNSDWEVGIIVEINDDSYVIEEMIERENKYQIKKDNLNKLAYFRRYSKPSEENYINNRENKESLLKRLKCLESLLKEKDNENYILKIDNKLSAWEIYYFLHNNIYFGLDYAMKINDSYISIYSSNENEGVEESLRIILDILYFISQYFKYLLDNKDDFINYQNNKEKEEFIDLPIVNKKYAFFSFFEESLYLLNKIFANCKDYLYWYKTFDEELKNLIPSTLLKNNTNPEFPLYEEEENNDKSGNEENETATDKNTSEKNKNELVLKKICAKKAYKTGTTFTTEKIKIRAYYLAYFIDYFNALNGFSYFFQLAYCSFEANINYLLLIYEAFLSAKVITEIYKNLKEEKNKLLDFNYKYFENLNEKSLKDNKSEDIYKLINMFPVYVAKDTKEEQRIKENLFFIYTTKELLLSTKLEEKISAINEINNILKSIQDYTDIYSHGKIKIKYMNLEEFCEGCKKYKLFESLLNDKDVDEEIIKKLPEIIFAMYKNDFGYKNREEDKEKIKSEKKLIFNALFNKLESEQKSK